MMEYVYSAMLLHAAKKEITEDSVNAVLKAAGIEADTARTKALVASLKDINIEEAIEKAAVATVATVAAPAEGAAKAKEEDKEEDHKKTEEEAAAGLSSLFGQFHCVARPLRRVARGRVPSVTGQ